MKNNRILITCFASLIFTTTGYGQQLKYNMLQKDNPIVDSFRVVLTNESLSITFQNNPLQISDLQQFDTYLKNNHPSLSQSQIFLESFTDTKYERKKGLMDILNRYGYKKMMGIVKRSN
jgi:hypothetical protein